MSGAGVNDVRSEDGDGCDIRLRARIGTIMICNKKSSTSLGSRRAKDCVRCVKVSGILVYIEDIMPWIK